MKQRVFKYTEWMATINQKPEAKEKSYTHKELKGKSKKRPSRFDK